MWGALGLVLAAMGCSGAAAVFWVRSLPWLSALVVTPRDRSIRGGGALVGALVVSGLWVTLLSIMRFPWSLVALVGSVVVGGVVMGEGVKRLERSGW